MDRYLVICCAENAEVIEKDMEEFLAEIVGVRGVPILMENETIPRDKIHVFRNGEYVGHVAIHDDMVRDVPAKTKAKKAPKTDLH